eukprot:gene7039-14316_t
MANGEQTSAEVIPSAKRFKSSDLEAIASNIEGCGAANVEIPENSIVNRTESIFHFDVDPGWQNIFTSESKKEYFKNLSLFIEQESQRSTIFPTHADIFNAFKLCAYDNVKVVILGQDPYHGQGQAHGLSFSVKRGITPPPSLKNIFKEAKEDVGIKIPNHGCLEHWASQGVLLLNTCLTVRSGNPNSHQGKGWEEFTDMVVRELGRKEGIVFMLWGNPAQTKCKSIDGSRHHIIKTSHPSPLGASKTTLPFLGSRCFSRCNTALEQSGKTPIDWNLPNLP